MKRFSLLVSIFCLMVVFAYGQKSVSKPRKFPISKVAQSKPKVAIETALAPTVFPELNDSPLTILERPRPISKFDHGCRQETIRLRIAFLETGEIGKISPISGFSERLTQEAIEAAAKITFLPAVKDGKRITVKKVIEYRYHWAWM